MLSKAEEEKKSESKESICANHSQGSATKSRELESKQMDSCKISKNNNKQRNNKNKKNKKNSNNSSNKIKKNVNNKENPIENCFNSNKFDQYDIVEIQSLKSKCEWNGLLAQVLSYDNKTKRYAIQLQSDRNDKKTVTKALLLMKNLKLIYPISILKYQLSKNSKTHLNGVQCFICDKVLRNVCDVKHCMQCFVIYYCSDKCREKHCDMQFIMSRKIMGLQSKDWNPNAISDAKNLVNDANTRRFDLHTNTCNLYKHILVRNAIELNNIHSKFRFNIFNYLHRTIIRQRSFDDYTLLSSKIDENFKKYYFQSQKIPLIKSWQEYYQYYQLPMHHDISIRASDHLTIYHILVNYLKLKPIYNDPNTAPANASRMTGIKNDDNDHESKLIVIHLVGIENDAEILTQEHWIELLRLLPGYSFYIMFFGKQMNIPKKLYLQWGKKIQLFEKNKVVKGGNMFYKNNNKRYDHDDVYFLF